MNKKEILEFIEDNQVPFEPISGVLVYVLNEDRKRVGNIFLPETYKQSAIRSGEVLKGVIVTDPINCSEEPDLKKGTTIMFKAASGTALNVNGHQFHTVNLNEILAILNEDWI